MLAGVSVALFAGMLATAGATTTRPAHHKRARHRRHHGCLVPGTEKTVDQLYRPDMGAAIAYAHTRTGDIAFAVRTEHRFYGYRPDHVEWSASVVKAMLMVAYLDEPWVAHRRLNSYDHSLLSPMITLSDNTAASEVRNIVGNGALQALAHRVGMTHFATATIWGETQITARDQTKFLLHIDSYIARLHRPYAMRLLASIVPYERWGVGQVAPRGWNLFFKGGWGYGTGLVDHQVAVLIRGCARVSVAVLSMYDGSHAYGKQTLRQLFATLLSDLPRRFHRHTVKRTRLAT
jgi:Beta-lactamase enzyme family